MELKLALRVPGGADDSRAVAASGPTVCRYDPDFTSGTTNVLIVLEPQLLACPI